MNVVVVVLPCRKQPAGMAETVEHLLVQELVMHPADDAFGEGVLLRLTKCDVVQSHGALVGPV